MVERPAELAAWCEVNLGGRIREVLWEAGHLSTITAVRLHDDREVVLKSRDWVQSLPGCHAVHSHLWHRGFPCPEPLTGPLSVGSLAISAEAHLPGGEPGRGDDPGLAQRTAQALQRLVAMAPAPPSVPALEPPRPWAGWSDQRALPWPPPDEGIPLNGLPATAPLLPLASALNERLLSATLPTVVGHVDWYQGNLRWSNGELLAADDWDSIVALPEAALAGCAAASFRPDIPGVDPDGWPGAEIADTEEFLDHYQQAAGWTFSDDEIEVAWAAGLWQRVFDAAKALADGRPSAAAAQLRDADQRRARAGT